MPMYPTNLHQGQSPARKVSVWYIWGALSFFFFVVQCATGISMLLGMQHQLPNPLIHTLHFWSSNLLLASIALHLVAVFVLKLLGNPRVYGLMSGMALFVAAVVFATSGYLLPMDEVMYFGSGLLRQLLTLHVLVLPALTLPLLGAHLWLVRHEGQERQSARAQQDAGIGFSDVTAG